MSVRSFQVTGAEGARIRGDLWLPDHVTSAAPVVVGIHGFKGFRRWGFWPPIGAALNAAGFAFASFDMSHNGVGADGLVFDEPERFERNTWAFEEEDLGTVLSELRCGRLPEPARVDVERLALLGHSRGGGLAVVRGAADTGVRAVVALAPIATILRFDDETLARGLAVGSIPVVNTRTKEVLRFGKDAILEMKARKDLHDIAARHAVNLTVPLLVVHGEKDASVPPREGRALAAAAPHGRFVEIAGADHVMNCRHPWDGPTPQFEQFLDETLQFLRTHLA